MPSQFADAMEMLLSEHPKPAEVEEAVRLMELASSQGDGAASERCALFEALGMVRPQSWPRALDYLMLAAIQGSRSAQDQLRILADTSSDEPESPGESLWVALRSSVDIASKTRAPEKTSLSDHPRIRVARGFAAAAECRWLIEFARDRLRPATVYDHMTGRQILDPGRDNSYLILRIGEMNVFTEVIRNRISAATRLPVPLFEPSQVLHYAVGERFTPHHDFLDPANPAYSEDLARFGQRIATFLIYLNSGYEGGETTFPEIGLSFRGETGDALFLANVRRDGTPDPATLHAGLPPASGEKWIFSQWIRDRLPRN